MFFITNRAFENYIIYEQYNPLNVYKHIFIAKIFTLIFTCSLICTETFIIYLFHLHLFVQTVWESKMILIVTYEMFLVINTFFMKILDMIFIIVQEIYITTLK